MLIVDQPGGMLALRLSCFKASSFRGAPRPKLGGWLESMALAGRLCSYCEHWLRDEQWIHHLKDTRHRRRYLEKQGASWRSLRRLLFNRQPEPEPPRTHFLHWEPEEEVVIVEPAPEPPIVQPDPEPIYELYPGGIPGLQAST